MRELEGEQQRNRELLSVVQERIRSLGMRQFAANAGIDASNLSKTIRGVRPRGSVLRQKLKIVSMEMQAETP